MAKQYFSTESKTTKLTFENIGKLSTQEVRCTTVKSESKDRKLFGKSIPFTKSEIIYSYDTDIQAGYDFTKIRYTVKDGAKNEKGKICVHLPEVEIISCDIDKDSFKLYHEDDNIFSPISRIEEDKNEFQIVKEEDMYVVIGPAVEKLMSRVNLEDTESMYYFQRKLDELGVNEALKKAGVKDGDTVKVVDWELEWYD